MLLYFLLYETSRLFIFTAKLSIFLEKWSENFIHFRPLWLKVRKTHLCIILFCLPLSPDTTAKRVARSCNMDAPLFASDARQSSYMD